MGSGKEVMVKKRGRPRSEKTDKPTKREKLYLEDSDRFLNVRLTSAELLKLNQIARAQNRRIRESVFPIVLNYLKDCAHANDRNKVLRVDEVLKDHFWGTEEEIINPRVMPAYLTKSAGDRPRFTQQILSPRSLAHLRGLERYYRVSMSDLVGSALEYAHKKMLDEQSK